MKQKSSLSERVAHTKEEEEEEENASLYIKKRKEKRKARWKDSRKRDLRRRNSS